MKPNDGQGHFDFNRHAKFCCKNSHPLSFVGLSVLVGVFVNQKTWLFFYKISPFVGLVTIAIASYLWLQ